VTAVMRLPISWISSMADWFQVPAVYYYYYYYYYYYPFWIYPEWPDILLSSFYILNTSIRHCSRKRRQRTNEQNGKFKVKSGLQTVVENVYYIAKYQIATWTFTVTVSGGHIMTYVFTHVQW